MKESESGEAEAFDGGGVVVGWIVMIILHSPFPLFFVWRRPNSNEESSSSSKPTRGLTGLTSLIINRIG
jgi:hypothetical protein